MNLDLLIQRVADAPPYAIGVSLPYALALALVAAEVAWLTGTPGRGRSRRTILLSAGAAVTMGIGGVLVGIFYAGLLRRLWGVLGGYQLPGLAWLWDAVPLLHWAFAFIAWDFAGWVYHVVGHRTRVGWAAHRPHHTGELYNATLGLRQTWVPFHGLAIHPFLALLGFDLKVVLICAAISNSWQILEHTSVAVAFPRWFSEVVMTPDAHRHHHGLEGGAVNLGPFFTYWDRLAGTWRPPDAAPPHAYGLRKGSTNNVLRVEFDGWLELLARGSSSRTCSGPTETDRSVGPERVQLRLRSDAAR